jgi:hypothetical protein
VIAGTSLGAAGQRARIVPAAQAESICFLSTLHLSTTSKEPSWNFR